MKAALAKGATDVTIGLYVQTPAGAALTGLLYNTLMLTSAYVRVGEAGASLPLVTQTVAGAHVDGGFVEVNATTLPGVYRLDLPDAVLAAGVDSVVVVLEGAVNMRQLVIDIQLTIFDLNSAAPDVNVAQVSGDATAADNLESQYDTTGLVGDTFPASQAQVGTISSGAGGLGVDVDSATITTGSETGTYSNTIAADGVYHLVEDDGGATSFIYDFEVGGTGEGTSIDWQGYARGNGSTWTIEAYDWVGATWRQIGEIAGTAPVTLQTDTWDLTNRYTGTGANAGQVRLRVESADGAEFATDRILCRYSSVGSAVGYANGSIWVDTVNGVAGVVANVNGTADNPVLTEADARTLSSLVGLSRWEISNGSTITLSATSDYFTMVGKNWTLILNSQSIANAHFEGAEVSGVASGASCQFESCSIGNGADFESDPFILDNCIIVGGVVLGSAGTYHMLDCKSAIAGTATPSIDIGVGIGDTQVNFRNYSGGMEFLNLGQTGTDNVSLEGQGQFILNANCVGGIIAVRGSFSKIDDTGGAVTIVDDANFTTSILESGFAQGPGTGDNQIQLALAAPSEDGRFDPAKIIIIEGTGKGQTRLVFEYIGATRICVVDRNWKVKPDTTSQYRVMADAGREHVNEGLARGGDADSIILNVLASSFDDAYIGQMIFLRSGTGEDQANICISYNGTTKEAGVKYAWEVPPDTTTGYTVLPCGFQNVMMAEAGDEMDLLDAAITSAKFDESTAFPTVNDISVDDIMAFTIDGSVDFETAMKFILSGTVGKVVVTGTDPLSIAFRNLADDADLFILTKPVGTSGRTTDAS